MREKQVFNFGDTSFRRKDYGTALPFCLSTLIGMGIDDDSVCWRKNDSVQAQYYRLLLHNSDYFKGREESDDPRKRARTNTNVLVKLGLINSDRVASTLSKNWILKGKIKPADLIESTMGLKNDNLIYLRQLLKVRLYSKVGDKFVYPFRYILKLLSAVADLPKDIFSPFLYAISPLMDAATIDNLIDLAKSYNPEFDAKTEERRIKAEISKIQSSLDGEVIKSRDQIAKLFKSTEFTNNSLSDCSEAFRQQFTEVFYNRKSGRFVADYFLFIKYLKQVTEEPTSQSIALLKEVSKRKSNISAFGCGKNPFIFGSKRHISPYDFLIKNRDNPYLSDDGNGYTIYQEFRRSKHKELTNEYLDMNKRIMELSGIIADHGGRFYLRYRDLWKSLFDFAEIKLVGEEDYSEYESNISSPFYTDLSLVEIIGKGCPPEWPHNFLMRFAEAHNLSSLAELQNRYEEKRIEDFKSFIITNFSKETVIEILSNINKHNADRVTAEKADKAVKAKVTESTDIPTIFEYILNIAWFYLSEEKTDPLNSMNLVCDGNMLPLTHAPGGAGDIEVRQDASTIVLLEATLMNPNAQKRAEMEPVIRHAANLTVENPGYNVQTIFCANQIDDDVANIYRATSMVELYHSAIQDCRPANGTNIFSITIQELIGFLQDEDMTAGIMLRMMDGFFQQDRSTPKNWAWGNWRKNRINQMIEVTQQK